MFKISKIILTARITTFITGSGLLLLTGCSQPPEKEKITIQTVPAFKVTSASVKTSKQFSVTLEGISDIEIRPQAEGYLRKIYVDEGSFVRKGQPLFLIHDSPYTEQLNQASAALQTARANAEKARIEAIRIEKLVAGRVISEVQLHSAKAELDAANALVAQTEAAQNNARIKKEFTFIKAPVNGYVGKLPYRVGSLVGHNELEPLTVLSDIGTIYAYFSMSEAAFMNFKQRYQGQTLEGKLKNVPPVTLLLADNLPYQHKGKVDIVQGQFDKNTGSITFRASFPNPGGLIRSGNTGKVLLPVFSENAIQIPQAATFELQNKIMTYLIGKDNKLRSISLTIADRDKLNYIVSHGLNAGDQIVAQGLDRLQEGMQVKTSKQ